MALIKCEECGKKISNKAKVCPHCGVEIDEETLAIRTKRNKKGRSFLFLLIFILLFLIFRREGDYPRTHDKPTIFATTSTVKKNEEPQKQPVSPESKIAPMAIQPMTKENYPRFYKKFGKRMNDANKYLREAALLVAESDKCDMVGDVSMSEDRSTLKNLSFFVDCNNGERFRLSENDIKNKIKARAASEQNYNEPKLRESCFQALRQSVNFPLELKLHEVMGTASTIDKYTGDLIIRSDFEAKNAFGVEIGYTALCFFSPNGESNIKIIERNK